MLLTLFAFGLGCLIGRARGGRWSGVTSARLHGSGWLVLAITTMLVVNLIGPAVPLAWALVGALAFIVFGVKNLQITGMIVLLVGLMMNLAPLIANGATPVSELALQSVGEIDDAGEPLIEGLRESSDTATAFGAFGDVIPVPLFSIVVSLGDLVMLVALADIAMNLLMRHRNRSDETDREASGTLGTPAPDRVAILSPLNLGVSSRPAHAAHRRPRRKAAPSSHVPAHAATPSALLEDSVIVLDGPGAYVEQPPPPTGSPIELASSIDARPTATETPGRSDHVDDVAMSGGSPDKRTKRERSSRSDHVDDVAMSGGSPDKRTKRERSSRSDHVDDVAMSGGSPDKRTKRERSSRSDHVDDVAMSGGSPDKRTKRERSSRSDHVDDVAMSGGSPDKRTKRERSSRSDHVDDVAMSGGSPDNIIDLTDPADRRPIIDLTSSPTDEQLCEFLRRRAMADAELAARPIRAAGSRRGRSPRRSRTREISGGVAE